MNYHQSVQGDTNFGGMGVTNLYHNNPDSSPMYDGQHNLYQQPTINRINTNRPAPQGPEQFYQSHNPRYSSNQHNPRNSGNLQQIMDFKVQPLAGDGRPSFSRRQVNSHAVKSSSVQVNGRKSNNILPDLIDPAFRNYHRDSNTRQNFDIGLGGPIPAAQFTEVGVNRIIPQEQIVQPYFPAVDQVSRVQELNPRMSGDRSAYHSNPPHRLHHGPLQGQDPSIIEVGEFGRSLARIQLQPDPVQSSALQPNREKLNQLMEKYGKRQEQPEVTQLHLQNPQRVNLFLIRMVLNSNKIEALNLK
jgi:hypothetical protein